MNTTLLVNVSGDFQRLDLFEEIPITLTIQQSDITNLQARRVPYSRVIQLPNTPANALIFEHFFEVNGTDFNPLTKLNCVVQYRGTDLFQGILRMNSVSSSINNRVWEVYILGEVADFTSQLQDKLLQELDWTDLQHEPTYDNIVLSWEAKNNDTDGLFGGKVLYPMINYGLDYQNIDVPSAATPSFTYSFDGPRSFDNPSFPVPTKMFKPALRIKEVLNRIFALTDYQVVSEFFDTDYFKSLYMDTFQNGQIGLGDQDATGVTNQNIFLVGNRQFRFKFDGGGELKQLRFFDYLPGAYDPLSNWDNAVGAFRVPYQGDYAFNFRCDPKVYDPTMIATISIVAFVSNDPNDLTNGTPIQVSNPIILDPITNPPQNYFFSATCSPGQYISLFVQEHFTPIYFGFSSNRGQYGLLPYNEYGIQDNFVQFDLYNGPVLNQQTVDFSLGLANLSCLEFIKSMITMFNLVIYQDETTKQLRIEPYSWYYNDNDRNVQDWTQRLDQNTFTKIEPLSFELSKEVEWTYKFADFEYLNKLFTDRFDYDYGRIRFVSQDNIFTGEQIYELPFAALPTSGITGAPNFIIPQNYYLNNGLQTPYATLPHIFFWVGNRYCYKDKLAFEEGSWYMLSGSTPVEWTTYPCVSHLSLLDTTLPNLVSDLSFLSTFDFFGNSNNQVAQFTPFDLFSTFWESFVSNLYSPETRRLSGNFFFRPLDVYNTKLNDKIFIKDANYTIEKITDANLVNKVITPISLIKDVFPYYKIEPPEPVYLLSPNEPYPGVEPLFNVACYVSTDITSVCNGTATIETVYSFGTGLQNFRKVYEDTGTSYQIFQAGTYLRATTAGSQLYVVADNYGRIIQQNC